MLQFVDNLNDQYAPLIVQLQSNASFRLGERVDMGAAAAVHIFTATFDSLIGPQFRYEIFNSTAYCGENDAVVGEAFQRATSNSPDVITNSVDAGTADIPGIGVDGADAIVGGGPDLESAEVTGEESAAAASHTSRLGAGWASVTAAVLVGLLYGHAEM